VTVALLAALGQVADALSFPLALGHGVELNPVATALLAAGGLGLVWAVKGLAAAALGVSAHRLPHRRTVWLWLAVVGFVGCLSNLVAAL
jgi:hypothetical protein